MINTKFLLIISFIVISIVYNMFLPPNKITSIILGEYIVIGLTLMLMIIYISFRLKLKDKILFEFIPNINYVPIKSTFIFFAIFQVVDFYYEDGLIGMISQWFMYWIFALLAYFLTHNINYYKNYKAYKDNTEF